MISRWFIKLKGLIVFISPKKGAQYGVGHQDHNKCRLSSILQFLPEAKWMMSVVQHFQGNCCNPNYCHFEKGLAVALFTILWASMLVDRCISGGVHCDWFIKVNSSTVRAVCWELMFYSIALVHSWTGNMLCSVDTGFWFYLIYKFFKGATRTFSKSWSCSWWQFMGICALLRESQYTFSLVIVTALAVSTQTLESIDTNIYYQFPSD